ncbi:MAG: hypothetical protein RR398_05745 [Clostridia bacterium]
MNLIVSKIEKTPDITLNELIDEFKQQIFESAFGEYVQEFIAPTIKKGDTLIPDNGSVHKVTPTPLSAQYRRTVASTVFFLSRNPLI